VSGSGYSPVVVETIRVITPGYKMQAFNISYFGYAQWLFQAAPGVASEFLPAVNSNGR